MEEREKTSLPSSFETVASRLFPTFTADVEIAAIHRFATGAQSVIVPRQ
jgi:hypothetical protein